MIQQNSVWPDWLKSIMSDPLVGYMRGIHMTAWIIVIIIMYIIAAVFFRRARGEGLLDSQRWIYRSFGLLMVFMGITRISFVFAYIIEPYYNMFLALGYAFGALSLVPVIFVIEKWLIRWSHRIFSILTIGITVMSFYFVIFNDRSVLCRTIQAIAMPFILLCFLILYVYVIKNSTGSIRKKAVITLLGIFVFLAGIMLDSESMLEATAGSSFFILVLFAAPVIFTLGMVMIAVAQKLD